MEDCRLVAGFDICRQDDGTIAVSPEFDDEWTIIDQQDAPAVALALLGGITDELVEQCAQAIHHRWNPRNPQQPWLWWENGAEQYRENRRADARAVLAAIGGGGEG